MLGESAVGSAMSNALSAPDLQNGLLHADGLLMAWLLASGPRRLRVDCSGLVWPESFECQDARALWARARARASRRLGSGPDPILEGRGCSGQLPIGCSCAEKSLLELPEAWNSDRGISARRGC